MVSPIRNKLLRVILLTALVTGLLLSLSWIISIFNLRSAVFKHSDQLGETAAGESEAALVNQVQQQLMNLAQDKAALIDERLLGIQYQTQMIADMATQIYTHKNQYPPRPIGYLEPSRIGTPVPHLRTAPGVNLGDIRNEVYLAANVIDMLRQITVVDTGIQANYIGGESGFFITLDKNAAGPYNTSYDVTSRSWYHGAKQRGGVFWTDIFIDSSSRGPSIACAIPFYDLSSGQAVFKGVAGSGTTIAEAVKWIIDATQVGETGYAFLLNEKGQVFLSSQHRDPSRTEAEIVDYLHSDDPLIQALTEKMINRERGLMAGVKLQGKPVFIAWHPLAPVQWSLGIVAPVEEVIGPAKNIQRNILSLTVDEINRINLQILQGFLVAGAITLFLMLITVFLAHRLANSFTVPIIALSEGAKIISAGNINHRFEIKTGDELDLLADTFNQMISNIKNITGERERIKTELTIAATIQDSMLPWVFPPFPEYREFDIYAEMHPAKEVGGDFYDFFLIDEHTLGVVIADVSGKGVPAALFMVVTKTLIKDHAQMGKPLDEVFYVVNNQLCENNQAAMFVTVFMGALEIHTGRFSYVNAGHNPPLIRRGGVFTWLETKPGLVLGAMENVPFKVMETTLSIEDMVFLYTDGVTEAMDREGRLFSNQRLLEAMNRSTAPLAIRDYIEQILQEIQEFAEGAEQADDITMLILERSGSP